MYDIARIQATMLAVTELSIELPMKAPDAEVRELSDFPGDREQLDDADFEQPQQEIE